MKNMFGIELVKYFDASHEAVSTVEMLCEFGLQPKLKSRDEIPRAMP